MFQILEFNKYLQLQYSFLFCPLSHALLSIYRCKMTNSQFFKCNHDVKQVLPFWTTCCLKNTLLRLFQIIIQIPFKLHTFQNPSALGHLNSPQVWYSDPNSNIKLLMLQRRYESWGNLAQWSSAYGAKGPGFKKKYNKCMRS